MAMFPEVPKPIRPGTRTSVPAEYVPAPQSVQDVAPVDAEYLPTLQSVHTAEPKPALYFPAVHNTHVPPSCPGVAGVAPGLQVQSVMEYDPVIAEYLPTLQLVQTEAPAAVEYVPALQLEHEEPASEYLPAAQATQAARLPEPAGDVFPAVQLVQVVDEYAPTAVENLPAMHAVQTVAPLSGI